MVIDQPIILFPKLNKNYEEGEGDDSPFLKPSTSLPVLCYSILSLWYANWV